MNIVLLFGGKSFEHEISLLSASYILKLLVELSHTVYPVAVDIEGHWILSDLEAQLEHAHTHNALFVPDLQSMSNELQQTQSVWTMPSKGIWMNERSPSRLEIDCVFPIIHGHTGEDGIIQGLLQTANLAYTGCDCAASVVGIHKHITKALLAYHDLPVVPYVTLYQSQYQSTLQSCMQLLDFPMIIKPSECGSSIGIHTAHNEKELALYIDDAFSYSSAIIVEPLLSPIREIETSILEVNQEIKSFLPCEIIIKDNAVYDYDLKYKDTNQIAYPQIPADLPPHIAKKIQKFSEAVFVILNCKGYARIDFFLLPDETIYINEINTSPGFTSISMFPKIVNQDYYSHELITHIIDDAIFAHKISNQRKFSTQ